MTTIFADTSAFAKRYIAEIGSVWVQNWIDPHVGNLIVVAEISRVEFTSLIARRTREGRISSSDFTRIYNDFLIHFKQQYRVISAGKIILRIAEQLLAQYPLRTLDAIQLATAWQFAKTLQQSPTFISADVKLLSIAAQMGFTIDDPNQHP